MKLDNKGFSLLELVLSIVLIGIVLLFLFQLLMDVKNETTNNTYSFTNQFNRVDGIYKIGEDLRFHRVKKVELINQNLSTGIIVGYKFTFEDDRISNMELVKNGNNYYINYKDYDNNNNKFLMKNVTVDPCTSFTVSDINSNDDFYFKINIILYSKPEHPKNSKDYNNLVDDIELIGYGNVSKIENVDNNLLKSDIRYQNIGACTN